MSTKIQKIHKTTVRMGESTEKISQELLASLEAEDFNASCQLQLCEAHKYYVSI